MSEWISIKDEMPRMGEPVLLIQTFPSKTMFNLRADPLGKCFYLVGGLRYDGKFVSFDNQYSEMGIGHISHWMPLPELPKDES